MLKHNVTLIFAHQLEIVKYPASNFLRTISSLILTLKFNFEKFEAVFACKKLKNTTLPGFAF